MNFKAGRIRRVAVMINLDEELVMTMELLSKDGQYREKIEIPIASEIAQIKMLMSCANVKKLSDLNGKSVEIHFNDTGELVFIARDVIWWRNPNAIQ